MKSIYGPAKYYFQYISFLVVALSILMFIIPAEGMAAEEQTIYGDCQVDIIDFVNSPDYGTNEPGVLIGFSSSKYCEYHRIDGDWVWGYQPTGGLPDNCKDDYLSLGEPVIGKKLISANVYELHFATPEQPNAPCDWSCDRYEVPQELESACRNDEGYKQSRDENMVAGDYSCLTSPAANNPKSFIWADCSLCPKEKRQGGDPVDLYTGNYHYEETDLGYPSPSMAAITRMYSAQNDYAGLTGPFGAGTFTNFDITLSPVENNAGVVTSLLLEAPWGAKIAFGKDSVNGSKVYFIIRHAPDLHDAKAVYDTFTHETSLAFKNKTVLDFDSSGRLKMITLRNGNFITITRDSLDPAKITSVSDNTGRTIIVSYTTINEQDVISSIRDGDSVDLSVRRTVTYDYYTSPDVSLKDVTYWNNSRTSYTNHPSYGVVNSVTSFEDYTDPSTAIVEVVSSYAINPFFPHNPLRIIKQEFADGGVMDFSAQIVGSGQKTFIDMYTDTQDLIDSYTLIYDTWGVHEKTSLNQIGGEQYYVHDLYTNKMSQYLEEFEDEGSGTVQCRRVHFGYHQGDVDYSGQAGGGIDYFGSPLIAESSSSYPQGCVNLSPPTLPLGTGPIANIVDAAGNETTFSYSDNSKKFRKPIKVTDTLGNVTNLLYDTNGNLTSYRLPGHTDATQVGYTDPPVEGSNMPPGGLVNSITAPSGEQTLITYYQTGQVESIYKPGATWPALFTYDDIGRITAYQDFRGNTTTYAYPDFKTVVVTDPMGHDTTYRYDSTGSLLEYEDARGNIRRYEYTSTGLLERVSDLASQVEHDGGTVLSDTAQYQEFGRPLHMDDRSGSYVDFTYDNGGHHVTSTYSDGTVMEYISDQLGRLTEVKETANGVEQSVVYTYTYICDGCANTDKFPDRVKQMARHVNGLPTGMGTYVFEFDELGRTVRLNYAPGGLAGHTWYSYNADSSVHNMWAFSDTSDYQYQFTYDNSGHLTDTLMPSPLNLRAEYEYYGPAEPGAGRIKFLNYVRVDTGAIVERISYAYDLNGNVSYKDRQSMGQTWDDLLPADMATASFDNANRGSDIGGQALEYDANGNLRRKGDSIYVWDQRGRLMAANVPGYEITYEYNADGTLRKRRAVDTGDQSVKAAVLSYLGHRVRYEEISDSASGATYYITHTYGAGGVAASKISDAASYRYQYYMTDAQGSVIAVTDGSGQVLERFRYSPYGQMERETVGGSAYMNFGYTGVWRDPITGLLHFLYRVYDPELGTFMQEDPIGLAAGDVNFYRYVGNNPATYVDPLGLAIAPGYYDEEGNYQSAFTFTDREEYLDGLSTLGLDWLPDWAKSTLYALNRTIEESSILCMGMPRGVPKLPAANVRGITGYTKHGINQAISRDNVGVSARAILNAVRNPQKIVNQANGVVIYHGRYANVVVNSDGRIITVIGLGRSGLRSP